ncbi:MAG TPA: FtsX-like permease family protein [Niastella sp.]|nr:FtsX-like permease family protein [Niastella sp.]
MLKNYFKTLFRNMQKNKLHTAINIVGMAVAFTCTILLLLLVYFQSSFDSFHKNKARLYQVYKSSVGPQGVVRGGSMGYPVAPTLKSEGIGIEKATRYKYGGRGVKFGDKELDLQVQLVDPDFFSMFSFPIIKGNAVSPLGDVGNAAITEYAAAKLFGNTTAVGKQINVNVSGEWKALVVSAVMKDFPRNSSLNFDLLVRPEISPDYITAKDKWDNQHHPVYVQVSENATKKGVEAQLRHVVAKYNPEDTTFMKNKGFVPDEFGHLASLRLLPLKEVHFDTAIGGGNAISKSFLYILVLVSFVIVVIACFNFINLNIGLAFTRTKEIGIRKCLGAGKRQVWLQVWGESFITVLISMLIGTAATIFILAFLAKNTQLNITASLLYQPVVLLLLVSILFLVSFVASGYPSFIMGKLKTVDVLKGTISLKKPGVFRNALIVVQFVIACVLICATIIIYQQFRHMRQAPLGYTTASLVSIPIHDQGNGRAVVNAMRNRLSSQSVIVSVSGSTINMGVGQDGGTSKIGAGFDYNGRSVRTNIMPADYDILKTLNIATVEGRDFSNAYASDTSSAVIVTESMAKQLSDNAVIGLSFYADSSEPKWTVVGVIPDFHLYSMREKTEPLTLMISNKQLSYILIRVNTQNAAATMDLIKGAYAQVERGIEFKGSFVDENIDRWYQTEKTLSRMFSIAALVAIALSCMGLFGIAFIVIRQRVKEIGVRKVLGASVGNIALLVTGEFIKPVLIAIVIAIPIAWWAMQKWLEGFEYRVPMQWSLFLAAAFVALFIAIVTVSFQAVKAATANPVKSLRTE